MKKIITLFCLLFLISCGSKEEKKKGFEYNRIQKVDKNLRPNYPPTSA